MKNLITDLIEYKYSHYIFLIFFAFILLSVSSLQLWDQDEAAYAGMALEMIESGNWLVPEFIWSDVHRKPPLHIWNIAIMFKLFGINEFSVRISSVLFVLSTVFLVYKFTSLFSDRKTALASMLIVSTSLLIPMLGRIAVTDGTLLFFFTLCAYSAYRQLQQKAIRWFLLFWVSFALALLTKGPPIIIFVSIFFFILVIFYPDPKKLISFHPWIGMPLACLPFVLWAYYTTKLDDGKMLNWMIDFYVLKRFNNSMFGQTGPPGTHIIFILASFIPYLLYLPGALKNTYKQFRQKNKEVVFLTSWFVAAWLIYEFSPSKLPSYTVSAHIPLAILVARYGITTIGFNKILFFFHILLNGILILAVALVPYYLNFPSEVKLYWTLFGGLMLLLNILLILRISVKENSFFIFSGIAIVFQFGLSTLFFPAFDLLKLNTKGVAVQCGEKNEGLAIIGNDTGLPPSLPFYMKQYVGRISVSYYPSDWLLAYYDKTPAVLILKEQQCKSLMGFIPNSKVDTVHSFHLEKLSSYNYYLLKNNSWTHNNNESVHKINIGEPSTIKTVEEFEHMISKSPEWMVKVSEKAKLKNLPLQEMVNADAVFMHNYEVEVHELEQNIRRSDQWLEYLKTKADSLNIPIETMVNTEAKRIIDLHNIQ
jgi:4-amino-4-deoxy-L-arabinose transferase-like glycosyltransferase